MGCRERGSYARGVVYPTQDTSRMGRAMVKQEGADKNNSKRVRNIEENNVGTKVKSPKQDQLVLRSQTRPNKR